MSSLWEIFPEGHKFDLHMATCKEMETPGNPGEGINATCVETVNTHSETHTAPHNTVETKGVHTNYNLLKKVITDTIYSDTPANSNPSNTSDYWEGLNREVRLNEGWMAER